MLGLTSIAFRASANVGCAWGALHGLKPHHLELTQPPQLRHSFPEHQSTGIYLLFLWSVQFQDVWHTHYGTHEHSPASAGTHIEEHSISLFSAHSTRVCFSSLLCGTSPYIIRNRKELQFPSPSSRHHGKHNMPTMSMLCYTTQVILSLLQAPSLILYYCFSNRLCRDNSHLIYHGIRSFN